MNRNCIYLRKSRADLEAEARGELETLSKHRTALLQFAKKQNLNIIEIKEELASGESLIHRPKMLELLKEVEEGIYDAVLCMDMDRLGRGTMQEQGIILETFKKAKTKIITPRKVYDLDDEFDEEYSEFEAFMARKELKIITRRLQSGRVRSLEEGNYISTYPPYGYSIVKDETGRYLFPNPDQAPIVKLIFKMYLDGDGGTNISYHLNGMGCKSYTGGDWTTQTVNNVLKNPVYIGKLRWKMKEITKSSDPDKKKDSRTRPKEEWIITQGKHQPLVSVKEFEQAQEIRETKRHSPRRTPSFANPLAGLIVCGKCGKKMVLRGQRKQKPHIICTSKFCNNRSSKAEDIESRLLGALSEWLKDLKVDASRNTTSRRNSEGSYAVYQKALNTLKNELSELEKQKNTSHDLLERGVYDVETYLARSKQIAERIESAKVNIVKAEERLSKEKQATQTKKALVPKAKKVLELYHHTDEVEAKNKLLKSILEKVVYTKEQNQRKDDFSLTVFPRTH